jgi:G:T-mismatch repair DNA endonuclease (very short patch repair protein)
MRVPIGRRRSQLTGNKARDRKVNRLLRAKGWTVLRIWEHELARKNQVRLLKTPVGSQPLASLHFR